MNIDFHYGVIFILARTAGLTRDEAQTVAHACQYVDDATTDGLLKFRDGQRFERFASAHGMIDYRNRINEDNRESWIPFHFVPGGDGATFEDRLVCRPNSAIAQALVCDALARHRQDNALHRLGVTLHAYVDTWAHQGFSGIVSQHNHVDDITVDGSSHPGMTGKIAAAFEWLKDKIVAMTLSWYLPLGHGAALSFPISVDHVALHERFWDKDRPQQPGRFPCGGRPGLWCDTRLQGWQGGFEQHAGATGRDGRCLAGVAGCEPLGGCQ